MSPNFFTNAAAGEKALLIGSFKTANSELTLARENILKALASPDSLDFEQLERLQEGSFRHPLKLKVKPIFPQISMTTFLLG